MNSVRIEHGVQFNAIIAKTMKGKYVMHIVKVVTRECLRWFCIPRGRPEQMYRLDRRRMGKPQWTWVSGLVLMPNFAVGPSLKEWRQANNIAFVSTIYGGEQPSVVRWLRRKTGSSDYSVSILLLNAAVERRKARWPTKKDKMHSQTLRPDRWTELAYLHVDYGRKISSL